MEHFTEITNFLVDISQKATDIMMKHYSPVGIAADIKSDNTPVTKADIEVNQMVIDEVSKHYPEYGVLGEELSESVSNKNLFVVDPIDGTLMFHLGIPLFNFSVAVVNDGVPVAGLISNPLAKRTLVAEQGKGTFCLETGDRVRVNQKETFEGALVHAGWKETAFANLVCELGGRTPMFYSVCEAAALIATGALVGEKFAYDTAHDVAAAKIIVEEAGGRVTDINGQEQRYDSAIRGAIISNGVLHEQLVDMVYKGGLNKFVNEL